MAMHNTETRAKTPRRKPANVPVASRASTAPKLEAAPDEFELAFADSGAPIRTPETEALRQQNLQLIEQLSSKRDEFVDRLDTGAAKIEEARAQGKDVSAWEDHWINLLRQYERVCDRLRELYVER
jgi:hypothetical protein